MSLVGTWKLTSFELRTSRGTIHPFGEDAQGRLNYDASGNMSALIFRNDLAPFASPDQAKATPDETRAAFGGCLSYFGTYSHDVEAGMVSHFVTHSLFPNWAGGEQKRICRLDGDTLELATPPMTHEGTTVEAVLVWSRA